MTLPMISASAVAMPETPKLAAVSWTMGSTEK